MSWNNEEHFEKSEKYLIKNIANIYQVQVFECFAQKKALHSIFQRFVQNIWQKKFTSKNVLFYI